MRHKLVLSIAIVLFFGLAFVSVAFLKTEQASPTSVSSTSGNILINGGFETGTFAGWWRDPTLAVAVAEINPTIVHGGSYSAFIRDRTWYSHHFVHQDVYMNAHLPVDS